eukprot:scaffold2194_cov130-Cylindrotheca_fusiformis.AAC.6
MDSRRRLWIVKTEGATDERKQLNNSTYETIFEKFSVQSPKQPLSSFVSKGLVVGQEFILSCLLLASHRFAQTAETAHADCNRTGDCILVHDEVNLVVLLVAWLSFVLLVAFYSKPRYDDNSSTTKQKLRTRISDSIFMAVLLRFLAGVLRTLTASYSSDTVHALAIASILWHLLACDYDYANGFADSTSVDKAKRATFQGGTLSLTAVFFATTLLASRLAGDVTVYLFVTYSVILFALYPAARNQIGINTQSRNKLVPVVITGQMVLFFALYVALCHFGQLPYRIQGFSYEDLGILLTCLERGKGKDVVTQKEQLASPKMNGNNNPCATRKCNI